MPTLLPLNRSCLNPGGKIHRAHPTKVSAEGFARPACCAISSIPHSGTGVVFSQLWLTFRSANGVTFASVSRALPEAGKNVCLARAEFVSPNFSAARMLASGGLSPTRTARATMPTALTVLNSGIVVSHAGFSLPLSLAGVFVCVCVCVSMVTSPVRHEAAMTKCDKPCL